MRRCWPPSSLCTALMVILLLIGTGCIEAEPADPPASEANPSPEQATLTAIKTVVKRLRGIDQKTFEPSEEDFIYVDDKILVGEQGRALLKFQDNLLVELLRDTELELSEVRLSPSGSVFLRLKQTLGTTLTELTSRAEARVTVDTEYATIRALTGDTKLLVCHAKALTCTVALEGRAEVEAQNEVVTINAGEASYVFPGEPPSLPIRANMEELRRWMDQKRGVQEIPPLGKLVDEWYQISAGTTPPPSPEVALLPSSDGMVRVEGGLYTIGSPQPDDYHIPPQEITADSFWIDQYEVTNAEYELFLNESGRAAPIGWPGQADHPVKGITWDEAAAFCAWTNKRLPTEAEWEIAARGPEPEPPLYPWGPNQDADGQVVQLPLVSTYAVGTMPFNKSPFDIYDLAGNVWEWVGEPYAPIQEGNKLLRGGRHGLLKDMAYRQQAKPTDERFVTFAGFRCASNHVEGE